MTSNWEVSTGCSLNNFINFTQTTQNFFIEAIETKLSFGKHILREFTEILKRMLAKLCLDAWFLCLHRFVAFHVTFNNLCS